MKSNATPDAWTTILDDPAIKEVGGEHNNEGVSFACYWAISLLIGLEKQNKTDYAIIFEYLQDIAVIDSRSAPTKADLYQVDTSDNPV